jgi:hypothetical protein
LAVTGTLAGAVNAAPSEGLVIETVGGEFTTGVTVILLRQTWQSPALSVAVAVRRRSRAQVRSARRYRAVLAVLTKLPFNNHLSHAAIRVAGFRWTVTGEPAVNDHPGTDW